MRCFLTGATGFVGSHVARILIASQVPTGVLVRDKTRTARLEKLLPSLELFEGNLHDEACVSDALRSFQPDTILHLGWTGVTAQERDDTIQLQNVSSTIRLVEWAADCGVKTIVGLGSQAEYGPKKRAIAEDCLCSPTSLYGASKLACCTLLEQLCRLSEMRFVWMRLFSCYGPGDHATFMIPRVIDQLLHGQKPALTSGTQWWDYLYVEDAANAIVHAAQKSEMSGVFNLGSGKAVELRQMIELLRDQIDPSLELGFGELACGPNAVMHLEADTRRLVDSGWTPKTGFAEGIKTTIEWAKKASAR